jgi:hypothetical protein
MARDKGAAAVLTWFGIYLALITVISVWLLIYIFPSPVGETTAWKFAPDLPLTNDQGFILLAILAGIIGSILHAGQSLTVYVGNQSLAMSWTFWYFARPWIGGLLGMLVYFVLRAGLASPTATSVTPYGVVAFGSLAGLFSQKAAQKLKEVFDTMFRTQEELKNPLEGSSTAPRIASVDVEPVEGAEETTVVVKGENFADGGKISIAGKEFATQFVDNQELRATVANADLPAAGQSKQVQVTNPAPEPLPSIPFSRKF